MTSPRRAAALDAARQAGADALLVTDPVNVRWLTGLVASAGSLLLAEGATMLTADGRYKEQARGLGGLEVSEGRGLGWVRERLPAGAKLAVEADRLTWAAARELAEAVGEERLLPVTELVAGLRVAKDDGEVAAVRRACAITVETLEGLLGWLTPGMTERAVAVRLERELVDRGAEAPAFAAIVAAGPNASRPHHEPSGALLSRGDLVVLDFGARVDGYCADLSRTLALGDPGPAARRLHAAVRAAQQAGVAAVRAGVAAGDVDAACRDLLAADGLGHAFVHPTGHALGLEIHEPPILRAGATARLPARATVTVEPGAYVPGTGGVRIEDTLLVTPGRAESLTPATTELVVL